jgi:branched-chain amino acid transport system substrate-binding protein
VPAPPPPGGATAGSGGGAGTTGATGSGSGGSGGGSGGGGSEAPPPPEVPLYEGAENTIGISDDHVRLCGHAALIFADAFDVRPEDLNVYWTELNENGGVHGRSVSIIWKDDAYSPDNAVQSAQACKAENPFFLLSGIGFDQIPAVRNWAQANRMLYLHHMAHAPSPNHTYSYSYQPTVDEVGRAFGEHIAAAYGDDKIGIVWRQSENWEPGRRRGRQEFDRRGVDVVADLPVQKNQGVYSQQIFELRSQGAEVVWIWENALVAAQFVQQAHDQGYRPKWVVFPFQTTLDVLGERALDPTMDGVATWPAYVRGGYGEAFADQGLQAEVERFEAAYAEHRPGVKTNDLLWQVWLGNKTLHDALERCGRDCTRNRMAGVWQFGGRQQVAPGCAVDFGRDGSFGGHIGGFQFLTHETFRTSDGPGWKNVTWCRDHLA